MNWLVDEAMFFFFFFYMLCEIADTDLASRSRSHAGSDALQSSHLWISKLVASLQRSEPEGDRVGKELTSAFDHAFNVWTCSEVFETRTWRDQRLTAAALTGRSVSKERVTHPHGPVAIWTTWQLSGLTVNG